MGMLKKPNYNIIFLITSHVIFQNKKDQNIIFSFLKKKINSTIIFPNTKFIGVNKKKIKKEKSNFFFCMYCRMIKEKGVFEYHTATRESNTFALVAPSPVC